MLLTCTDAFLSTDCAKAELKHSKRSGESLSKDVIIFSILSVQMVGVVLAKQIVVLVWSWHLLDALGLVHGHLVSVHVEGDVLPELGEGVKVDALAVDAHVGPGADLGLDPVQGHEVDVAATGQRLEQNVGAVVDVDLAQLELVGAAL